ncbi:MAG: glycosyltransferase [Candidatus Dormibacteraeota bacterium]|uniref:Glycosyltransferase n=1 Tax=Candidatus Aeolococcus gillhamiae TaxID=3127015 RepID=A0A934K1L9_9BACT|nr:glycosyltransferase [Candidatus Dormibacteraeota bacterium]
MGRTRGQARGLTHVPRPIRVLLIAQPFDAAGVPRHVLDIVEELHTDQRFELTVACPLPSVLWDRVGRMPGVRRMRFTSHRAPHPSDLLWLARLLPLVRRSDVVHGHSSKAAWLGRAAALLTGRRASSVVTPHAWSFWAFSGAPRRALIALERLAAHACATILAVSRHERDEGLRLGVGRREQYRVIPNGINLQRWSRDRTPDRDVVLMVGRLAPQKRPELAIRALALARHRRPTMRLVMAGSGELHDHVATLATQLGVRDAVHLVGDTDDVPNLMAGAGCLLMTSVYEGCSLAILEAMGAGVPVVAVRFGGVDELVDDGVTGLLSGESPEDIAAALVRLAGDAEMADGMGEEGRRRAQELYSRSRMAAGVAAVWETMAKRRA